MIMGIDHGYYAIKTRHFSFPAGVTAYTHEPYTLKNTLQIGGKYYVCGTGRQPILRDKTVNDNYYILTLAAIAMELRFRNLPAECSVTLAADLPLARYGRDKKPFTEYLFRNGQPVMFLFEGERYKVKIESVKLFPQGYSAAEMAGEYHFNSRQNEYLALMMQPDNQNLWAQLLGGLVAGGGQIITPDTDWVGTGPLAWPLPQSFPITSHFGYREDPFTGEIEYHNGTDIAAPEGTPILAAADGMVTIANGIDSWGGSYGYHIKIDHGNGLEALYAHCSAICVNSGQQVQQGEVIGFVGSTGNSTGNHLHFEAWMNGERKDAMKLI